jgi:hypothetical protein
MASAANELEQLAWGANDFEKQQDGLWAALLSARGHDLLAGTGLVSICSTQQQHTAYGTPIKNAAGSKYFAQTTTSSMLLDIIRSNISCQNMQFNRCTD